MPDLISQYETYQRRIGLSQNTIDLRNRQFASYAREVGPVVDATETTINEWLDGRTVKSGKGISDKTRSCYLTTFSSFFKWAVKKNHLLTNPIDKMDRPKVHNGMPNPIPERDLERAIAGCTNKMLKCWIVIEAYGGLRCQEVAYLADTDIQHDLRYDKNGKIIGYGRIYVRFGKGGKERYVPLTKAVVDALAEYEPPRPGRLWPNATPSTVSQRINRYYHGIGIVHTAHKNRHRYGTKLYKASGESLLTVQAALGHSDPKTSAIYAQVDNESVNTAAMLL